MLDYLKRGSFILIFALILIFFSLFVHSSIVDEASTMEIRCRYGIGGTEFGLDAVSSVYGECSVGDAKPASCNSVSAKVNTTKWCDSVQGTDVYCWAEVDCVLGGSGQTTPQALVYTIDFSGSRLACECNEDYHWFTGEGCCGDDGGEAYINATGLYDPELDNATPLNLSVEQCCTSIGYCINNSEHCIGAETLPAAEQDIDGDGDIDYCKSVAGYGVWVDCTTKNHCDKANGYFCDTGNNNCTKELPDPSDVIPHNGTIYAERRNETFITNHLTSAIEGGYTRIDSVYLLLNQYPIALQGPGGEESGFFYGMFNNTNDTFFIRDSFNTSWISAGQIGNMRSTCNAYACLQPDSIKTNTSPTQLVVNWSIRFKGGWEERNLSIYLKNVYDYGDKTGMVYVHGNLSLENDIEIKEMDCHSLVFDGPPPGDNADFEITVVYNNSDIKVPSPWAKCRVWKDSGLSDTTQPLCGSYSGTDVSGCYHKIPYGLPDDTNLSFLARCDGPDNDIAEFGDWDHEYYTDNNSCLVGNADPSMNFVSSYTENMFAGRDYIIEANATDPNGWEDIWQIILAFDHVDAGGDLSATNAPQIQWIMDPDTLSVYGGRYRINTISAPPFGYFSKFKDIHNYTTMNEYKDLSMIVRNNSNDTLMVRFNVTFNWNFDEADRDYGGMNITVYSRDSGTGDIPILEENTYMAYVENDINLTCSSDKDGANDGDLVNFSGTIRYQDSLEIPPSYVVGKGIYVNMSQGEDFKQRQDDISTGVFNFSQIVSSPSAVIQYLFYAQSNNSGYDVGVETHSNTCSVTMASDTIGEFTIILTTFGTEPSNYSINISTDDLDYVSADNRDIEFICELNEDTPFDGLGDQLSESGLPSSFEMDFYSIMDGKCVGENNYFYCTGRDPIYTSIRYQNRSKNITFDPDDEKIFCNACGYNDWAIGGESDPAACCGDDTEFKINTNFNNSLNGTLPSSNACCYADDKCVFEDTCYNDSSYTIDIDNDGDLDICDDGTWYDCVNDSQCNTAVGFYCGWSRNCSNICTHNSDCPDTSFCAEDGECTPKLPVGATCYDVTFEKTRSNLNMDYEDEACLTGYCDNDGLGLPDSRTCFNVTQKYYDQDGRCEFSVNYTDEAFFMGDERMPNQCFGVQGWTNASCYYFSDGDDNNETCMCKNDLTVSLLDQGTGWNIGGNISGSVCCGDDLIEWYLIARYNNTMDNGSQFSYSDSCCTSGTQCVDSSGNCYVTGFLKDIDLDGDNDYCNNGTWNDCLAHEHCPSEWSCVRKDCIDASPPIVQFVDPTPANNERMTDNRLQVNVTVNSSQDIHICMLKVINRGSSNYYLMQKNGLGSYVSCYFALDTIDGENYTYQVYANHTMWITGNSTKQKNVENAVPKYVMNTVENDTIHTGNRAMLNFTITDKNWDPVNVRIYGGNNPNPSVLISNSFSDIYTWSTYDGEMYYWRANFTDGYETNSTPVYEFYENNPPTTNLSLTPDSPLVSNDLTCNYDNLGDLDGEPVTIVNYNWIINGNVIGINNNILKRGNTTQNDVIKCMISLTDGNEIVSYKSEAETVMADGPIVINTSVADTEIRVGEKTTIDVVFQDNSGVNASFYVCRDRRCTNCNNVTQSGCFCYDNELKESPLSCEYQAKITDPHENDYWVNLFDNIHKSTIARGTDRSFLVNHAPIVDSLRAAYDAQKDKLVCKKGILYDKDDDNVTVKYKWYKNDVPIAGNTASISSPAKSGDSYYRCGATPKDEHNFTGALRLSTRYSFNNLAPSVTKSSSTDMVNVGEKVEFEVEFFDVDDEVAALFICADKSCTSCSYSNYNENSNCLCSNVSFKQKPLKCFYTAEENDRYNGNKYYVMVYDGAVYSKIEEGDDQFRVNHAPITRNIYLDPEEPTINDDITCNYQVTEPDGNSYHMNFDWYENNISMGQNISILSHVNLVEDNSYKCSVWATDQHGFSGAQKFSNESVVSSTRILSAFTEPNEVNITEPISIKTSYFAVGEGGVMSFVCKDENCTNCTFGDTANCYCNNYDYLNQNPRYCTFNTLANMNQHEYDYWVALHDGSKMTDIMKGNDTILINHKPELGNLNTNPTGFVLVNQGQVECSITSASDPDGDQYQVWITWYLNGVPKAQEEVTTTLRSTIQLNDAEWNEQEGDLIICRAEIKDEHYASNDKQKVLYVMEQLPTDKGSGCGPIIKVLDDYSQCCTEFTDYRIGWPPTSPVYYESGEEEGCYSNFHNPWCSVQQWYEDWVIQTDPLIRRAWLPNVTLGTTLHCCPQNFTEDHSEERYRSYYWRRNQYWVYDEGEKSLYVSPTKFKKGDVIYCEEKVWSQNSSYDHHVISWNNVTIINTPPEPPEMNSPADGNYTIFSRTGIVLDWNRSYDIDEVHPQSKEKLTYDIQVWMDPVCGDPMGCDPTIPDPIIEDFNLTETSITIPYELPVDTPIYWRLMAFDQEDYSVWSETHSFQIASTTGYTLSDTNISFGKLSIGFRRNTDVVNTPIYIVNDGNVFTDVWVWANESLWESEYARDLPNKYFTIKASDYGIEQGSYNITYSNMSWVNLSNRSMPVLGYFDFHDDQDKAAVDLGIEVPPNEPPGNKTAMVFFELISSQQR